MAGRCTALADIFYSLLPGQDATISCRASGRFQARKGRLVGPQRAFEASPTTAPLPPLSANKPSPPPREARTQLPELAPHPASKLPPPVRSCTTAPRRPLKRPPCVCAPAAAAAAVVVAAAAAAAAVAALRLPSASPPRTAPARGLDAGGDAAASTAHRLVLRVGREQRRRLSAAQPRWLCVSEALHRRECALFPLFALPSVLPSALHVTATPPPPRPGSRAP
ncbi:hypothetical protein P154DRAFT_1189 [Amniculicola lignicola CBS 123094]|uniref:Uncharacterized protein n=1 Tax=Amniculicola lignicola CBS 123094 TaxID=1392246 RepID=A0A6A5X443_9PLEO|nr:hypothetical protein P154DRAFT_1189 [Amniculicola lignicola CBS 123094]